MGVASAALLDRNSCPILLLLDMPMKLKEKSHFSRE
jgi:hypothetical protein